MTKIKLAFLTGIVSILTLFATISAASACQVTWYQPKLPKTLQK
ncbi:cyclic lactone autoinducer peptide [Zhaonella formicivorans]|jgi:cyclic lactone autoinducer peptide|nr:cyclic lactone autoinducer peptide [Zhaonella formicivorans]